MIMAKDSEKRRDAVNSIAIKVVLETFLVFYIYHLKHGIPWSGKAIKLLKRIHIM